MDRIRRKLLSLLSTGLIAGTLRSYSNDNYDSLKTKSFLNQDDIFYETQKVENGKPVLPKGLKKGSLVALTAPASHASSWELRSFMKTMKELEIKVEIGNTIKNYHVKNRYFSAPDEIRAEELMNFFLREDVDMIMTCRGGYGVMRILDMLDFVSICKNPKIIIGFSDITALLNTIFNCCNLVTYHGPAGISTFNTISTNSFKEILFHNENFKPIIYKDARIKTIIPGKAIGKLVGGNLTMLASTLGSPYEIKTDGCILFMEEVSEDPYKIDRMLTQLMISKKLNKCVGIMFGYYENLDRKYYFYPNRSYTAREVIETSFKKLGIPSVIGIPIGHMSDKWTMPIGVEAELNADKQTLTILEPAVK